MATTMYTELAIYGEALDPKHISDVLGMVPDKAWRKGDPKGSGGPPAKILRKDGCWKIVTAPSEDFSVSLNDHLRVLLDRIGPVRELLFGLSKVYLVEFACVINLDEGVPALHVDREVLKAMAAMSAELDFDIYL